MACLTPSCRYLLSCAVGDDGLIMSQPARHGPVPATAATTAPTSKAAAAADSADMLAPVKPGGSFSTGSMMRPPYGAAPGAARFGMTLAGATNTAKAPATAAATLFTMLLKLAPQEAITADVSDGITTRAAAGLSCAELLLSALLQEGPGRTTAAGDAGGKLGWGLVVAAVSLLVLRWGKQVLVAGKGRGGGGEQLQEGQQQPLLLLQKLLPALLLAAVATAQAAAQQPASLPLLLGVWGEGQKVLQVWLMGADEGNPF